MQMSSLLRVVALISVTAVPAVSFATSNISPNGHSIYGQAAAVSSAARVIDLAKTPKPNVSYGETVVFRADMGQQFAWTFNGVDWQGVDLAKIAPTGFSGKSAVVYIGRDLTSRH